MIRALLLGTMLPILSACIGTTAPPFAAPDLAKDVVPVSGDDPPGQPEGACWTRDTLPAVSQPQGQPGTGTDQQATRDPREFWVQTPCPTEITAEFVASLQRALAVRGLYDGPVSGAMDAETARAVRRYQAARGLDSATLSLTAAREMGLSAVDRSAL